MIELVLPVPTPSANRIWGTHWSKKAKWRKTWAWHVRAERLRLGLFPKPKEVGADQTTERVGKDQARAVTIERYGPRLLDHDNLVAGCKQLIDALVAEGFLVDDSPAHLSSTYRQHHGPKQKPYRTVVTIA